MSAHLSLQGRLQHPPRQRRQQPTRVRTVGTPGTVSVDSVIYKIDPGHVFEKVLVVVDGTNPGDRVIISTLDGEVIAEHTRPAPGITYVGNGKPRGPRPKAAQRVEAPSDNS